MAEQQREHKPHLFVSDFTKQHNYERPRRNVESAVRPPIDRTLHGRSLLAQISALDPIQEESVNIRTIAGFPSDGGLLLQFQSRANIDLVLNSLENKKLGIEVLNVKKIIIGNEKYMLATVFVPDGHLSSFEATFSEYLEKDLPPSIKHPDGRPARQELAESISEIRSAAFDAVWNDSDEALPTDDNDQVWWEVWLPVRRNRDDVIVRFKAVAAHIGATVGTDEQKFLERTILLMRASKAQITASMLLLDCVAELRRAKDTAEVFTGLETVEQREWIDELIGRTRQPNTRSPSVCLIDTGVNFGHPLIATGLSENNCHSVDPEWGVADEHGHGTELAGIALYGDLTDAFSSNLQVDLEHGLESVKLIRQPGDNTDKRLYGRVTGDAVARPEITNPLRKRVFNLAITCGDEHDRGRPSAWSSAIDELSFNIDEQPRLFVISAGNIEQGDWIDYPNSNSLRHIHDPAQAWNALTVGAHTEKTHLSEENMQDYRVIASAGELSPFSTTALNWKSAWPLKPDVVFEGGNAARTDIYQSPYAEPKDSLLLLTTNFHPTERLLTTTGMTSAASASCSRMVAQLMAQYPDAWPETIRALVVHSAEWTPEMQNQFLDRRRHKVHYTTLVQHFGFGVPSLERAQWSMNNSLTLVVQSELQPFQRLGSNPPKAKDMHLHALPWPKDQLEALGGDVKLRVTLSYFVEPNPGIVERGFNSRYCYESHGLRFKVKFPEETDAAFLRRINALAERDGETDAARDQDSGWYLGEQRHRGSIHSDIWTGSAANLASRGVIAIYPTSGWWKSRPALERYELRVRYALAVSIISPNVNTDLYTPIQEQIALARIQQAIQV